jgi:AcrR family transcriptional regulator
VTTRPITPRRAATRSRLVQATIEVVALRGFHDASVDEIAGHAGLSIGALYSNFESKDMLFLAAFEEHVAWFAQRVHGAADVDDPAEGIASWLEFRGEDAEQFLLFIDFWAYAVRQPELRRRLGAQMGELRGAMARAIEARAAARGDELPIPAELLALIVTALGRGLAIEQITDDKAVPARELSGLLATLFG